MFSFSFFIFTYLFSSLTRFFFSLFLWWRVLYNQWCSSPFSFLILRYPPPPQLGSSFSTLINCLAFVYLQVINLVYLWVISHSEASRSATPLNLHKRTYTRSHAHTRSHTDAWDLTLPLREDANKSFLHKRVTEAPDYTSWSRLQFYHSYRNIFISL